MSSLALAENCTSSELEKSDSKRKSFENILLKNSQGRSGSEASQNYLESKYVKDKNGDNQAWNSIKCIKSQTKGSLYPYEKNTYEDRSWNSKKIKIDSNHKTSIFYSYAKLEADQGRNILVDNQQHIDDRFLRQKFASVDPDYHDIGKAHDRLQKTRNVDSTSNDTSRSKYDGSIIVYDDYFLLENDHKSNSSSHSTESDDTVFHDPMSQSESVDYLVNEPLSPPSTPDKDHDSKCSDNMSTISQTKPPSLDESEDTVFHCPMSSLLGSVDMVIFDQRPPPITPDKEYDVNFSDYMSTISKTKPPSLNESENTVIHDPMTSHLGSVDQVVFDQRPPPITPDKEYDVNFSDYMSTICQTKSQSLNELENTMFHDPMSSQLGSVYQVVLDQRPPPSSPNAEHGIRRNDRMSKKYQSKTASPIKSENQVFYDPIRSVVFPQSSPPKITKAADHYMNHNDHISKKSQSKRSTNSNTRRPKQNDMLCCMDIIRFLLRGYVARKNGKREIVTAYFRMVNGSIIVFIFSIIFIYLLKASYSIIYQCKRC